MGKKKAIVCTLLFAVVFIVATVGTMFVKSEYCSLYEIFSNGVFCMWVLKKIENFYYWLTEE